MATAGPGIAQQWRDFDPAGVPGRLGSALYGVMCGADAESLEYMCGVEVASLEDVPQGIGRMRVPTQEYAVFVHDGSAGTVGDTWVAILAWLGGGAYESAHRPDFEVYPSGVDPSVPSASIEIWVGVVPRRTGGAVSA